MYLIEDFMRKNNYTKEEQDIINKWAISSDYEMEKKGHILGSSKKPITVLDMALKRKQAVERVKQELNDKIYGKVV